ncbi:MULTISPECIES: DUF5134 domain-containing protein [Streptomyces]|uniref:DUF5134 domain-containing protein n=1 Tax=Streptomyces TaxID=1883 RepID=UPI002176D4CA|nr:DUF5134 domain-containing protein [Streptomyces ginkgonis]
MHEGPVVVGWLLAALCGGTGLYCLHRARAGPGPVARRPAALEGAMGLGMAVMAVPGAGTAIPGQTYVLAFGALAVWAVVLRARPVHRAHHAVEALAMVWMAAAMPGHAGAAGHGGAHGAGGGLPVPTGMLIAYFALYVLVSGARIAAVAQVAQVAGSPAPAVAGAGAAGGGSTPPGYGGGEPSPAVAVACRTALSLGMLVMLVSM